MEIFNQKILLVDDNKELLKMIEDTLRRNGYENIVTANSVKTAIKCFQKEKPDLAVLDIMLPDGDGFYLFRRIREESQIPILFLSAKDEDNDRLFGLGLGADDYMTKPFLAQELVLRVGAILRRSYGSMKMENDLTLRKKEDGFYLGKKWISFAEATVTDEKNHIISFTAKELILLKKLYENRGRIVTFDSLCQEVWQDSYYGYENTLMVHIRHLREKIEEEPSKPKFLLTARGLGYRLAKGE
ncbi:MAG: response regulator transcription factor [Lachnospiraceae bacterium]